MESEAGDQSFAERLIHVFHYYTPVLFCVGTIGNCLSIYVLFRSEMRRSSASFYLAALAISDTGYLVSVLIPWLGIFDIHIFNKDGFCQFFTYLPTFCNFLSVWFVVSFTVERFVAVCYPLHRQSICTAARAKTIIICLTCIGIALCACIFWMARPTEIPPDPLACVMIEERAQLVFVFTIVDTVVTFMLPFAIIAVMNALIIKTVRKHVGVRKTLTNGSSSRKDEESSGQQSSSVAQTSISQTKITKMLLIISSVFLCLNLPSYAMRVYTFSKDHKDVPMAVQLAQHICDRIYDTSFGINFFLYCASGHNFRRAVVDTLCCCPRTWGSSIPGLVLRGATKSTSSSASHLTPQCTAVLDHPLDTTCELQNLPETGFRRNENIPTLETAVRSCDRVDDVFVLSRKL